VSAPLLHRGQGKPARHPAVPRGGGRPGPARQQAGPLQHPPGPAVAADLAPVREAMLRSARAQAAGMIAQARDQADGMLADARAQAARTVAQASEAGQRDAAALAAAQRNRGRQAARSLLLSAQREAYQDFRAQVRLAVSGLRHQPGYDVLRKRLAETAAALAGPGAVVTGAPGGGVIARAPGIVVDCSLSRLAGFAADALGAQAAQLWAPPPEEGT
jgi:vacuolar-type H+-ATPase subunit E/Vma4